MVRTLIAFLALLACAQSFAGAESSPTPLALDEAITEAIQSHPEIAAARSKADAEHSAIRSQYWLDSPRLGLMRESDMNDMEMRQGPMNFWSVSQDVKFPAKYLLMGSAQRSRAEAADQDVLEKKLEIRKRVISAYYGLYSADRILALLQAQRETLRELARIAETRHATGSVPQQDEMKAHVEQTKIESEILFAEEERETAEADLVSVLGDVSGGKITLPKGELAVPKVTVPVNDIPEMAQHQSKSLESVRLAAEEADTMKTLAYLSYAPDFTLSYKKATNAAPKDNYAVALEMTIPLWFFAKQTSEAAQGSASAIRAEKTYQAEVRTTHSEVRSLSLKVRNHEKLLKIYETALIPQATSTLDSSRAAYRAGRAGFLDLIDSERALYETQTAYYRTLSQYIEDLTLLEQRVGAVLSSLPAGGVLNED